MFNQGPKISLQWVGPPGRAIVEQKSVPPGEAAATTPADLQNTFR